MEFMIMTPIGNMTIARYTLLPPSGSRLPALSVWNEGLQRNRTVLTRWPRTPGKLCACCSKHAAPLISAPVAPPGAELTAGCLARAAAPRTRDGPLLAGGERRRGEHDHLLEASGGSDAQRQNHAAGSERRRVLQGAHRVSRCSSATFAHGNGERGRARCRPPRTSSGRQEWPNPHPNFAYPRTEPRVPSICSRRPYLGEASEARQEQPPTTESLRLAALVPGGVAQEIDPTSRYKIRKWTLRPCT